MFGIPSPLRLVKYRDPLDRRVGVCEAAVPKVHNVLDKTIHLPSRVRLLWSSRLAPLNVRARREQGLTQHLDQRAVSPTKTPHARLRAPWCARSPELSPAKVFPAPGTPYKADGFAPIGLRVLDNLAKTGRRLAQVLRARIRTRNVFNLVALVQCLRRLNNGGRGLVASPRPAFSVSAAVWRSAMTPRQYRRDRLHLF